MNNNQKTLQSYEDHIQEYVNGTPQVVGAHVKEWLDEALKCVPIGGSILELGSAFGRDADYIEQAGYIVRRTDATEGFVQLLRSQGHKADVLNAITDNLGGPYDMVLANAVLLHFTLEETQAVLAKIHASLKKVGTLAFSVKQGHGSEWSSGKLGAPRYFQYYDEYELRHMLMREGFSIRSLNAADNQKWWMAIVQS